MPIHFFSPLFYPVGRGFGSALMGQYADVAQLAEHRAGRYAQVQVLPSAPDAGSHPDNVRPSVVAHMEMKMVAENCTVGGNRLSVMVLRM